MSALTVALAALGIGALIALMILLVAVMRHPVPDWEGDPKDVHWPKEGDF